MATVLRTPVRVPPWLLAALTAALWFALAPPTPDLAAQVFRSTIWARDGFEVFNANWYGGHHLPGYSLTFPPLGAWLGPRVVGAAAAVLSAVLFDRLARGHFGDRARWGVAWFAVGTACDLLIGRLTFGLGVMFGLAALLALQRGRPRLSVVLAATSAATSPVAGAFLMLAGAAAFLGAGGPLRQRARAPLALGLAAMTTILVLVAAFPEGGRQPMSVGAVTAICGFSAALLVALPRRESVVRAGALLYLVAGLASFLVDTPMGSNTARLGATFAGPLLVCAALRPTAGHGRRALIAGLAVAMAAWQWLAPVREVVKGTTDPSTRAAYHAPVAAFLRAQGGPVGRVEVPFTQGHWEAVHLGSTFALARGWETQLDTRYNALFYDGTVGVSTYRAWLRRNGVRWVAVPDVPLDPSGLKEAALIALGLPYLRLRHRTAHWAIYEVRGATALTRGPATLTRLDRGGFTLHARRPGAVTVRVRFTPYWLAAQPGACVARARGGWTLVRAARPGPLRVRATFAADRVLRHGSRCTNRSPR